MACSSNTGGSAEMDSCDLLPESKPDRTNNEAALSYDANNCQVRVGVRIRPLASTETSHGGKTIVFANDIQRTISIGKKQERTFTYDMVFDSNTNQAHLYDRVKNQLLGAFLDGFNATIMAYGQTGSGKTYTMGSDSHPNLLVDYPNGILESTFDTANSLAAPLQEKREKPIDELDSESYGLIPRFMYDIFAALEQMASTKNESSPTSTFQLTASFIEVYGEDVYDLLDKSGASGGERKSLPIREDSSGTVMVVGLSQIPISSVSESLSVLQQGTLNRTTAATLMNQCSSRSHAVFTIWLQRTTITARSSKTNMSESPPLDVTTSSRLTFVDLAGSERMKKTGAEGERMREGIKINEGLLALGNVINALADEERLSKGTKPIHVPYRQTKLTRLLQDALGGNSQTLFLACVSPSDTNVSETLSTLQYANRARNIKNAPTKNVDRSALELQRLNAWTNVLQCELIKHRYGGYHYSSLLPLRLNEEEELCERAAVIDDSFAMEDLLQRQDVQQYLREIYQRALEQKPNITAEGSSISSFIETAATSTASTVITNITTVPSRSRSNTLVTAPQLSGAASHPMIGPPSFSAAANSSAKHELSQSSVPPNDDFETAALLEVNPNEDMAILDQLLELQQHELEFNSTQKEEQKLLTDVEGELRQKEELLLQLRHSLEIYHDMKNRYEALLAEVQSLEGEKLSLTEQLERALQDPAKGCSVAIRKKLEQVEQTLIRTRNETKKHQQLYRKAEQEAQKCRLLERKITELKQSKVNLIRKQREAASKHKEFTEQKTREIQALKKSERKNKQQLSKLEVECRHHKINLERRRVYGDKLSLKLKETESHLMKLLTIRKKEVQERTRSLQSSTRTSNRFSNSFIPYKSLRASGTMPSLITDHEGDEERAFAPLDDETSSVVFLLKRMISDKVAQAHGRKRYEENLLEYSKLMKQMMEEVNLVNDLRRGKSETETTSDDILDHEKNLEDLELRIELMNSNLEELRARLELGDSEEADAEDPENQVQNKSSEITLISSCPAPVARTVLWEIIGAFSKSELEVRILEESMQRKDAAIRGLEQETDKLSRQLSSLSKDYNDLRESLTADRVELDGYGRLGELEKEVSALMHELETRSQQELALSTSLEQLHVCLADRERDLAKAQEILALQEANRKHQDENTEARTLLSNLQSIWEELGVDVQSRDAARIKIERCLEETCNRLFEDATALRIETSNSIELYERRLATVRAALGMESCDVEYTTGLVESTVALVPMDDNYKKKLRRYQHSYGGKKSHDIDTTSSNSRSGMMPLLHVLNSYKNKLEKLQPRYNAAKERRDKLALDVKNILKVMAYPDDELSTNLKKLLSDCVEETEKPIKVDPILSKEMSVFANSPVGNLEEAGKNITKLESPNSLAEVFLDACEEDLKALRLRKREILIGNNVLCERTRLLVGEMCISPKEMLSVCTRLTRKRSQHMPQWWDSDVAFSVCETLSQKDSVAGVSELYTKHLAMITEILQTVSIGRNAFAGSLRLVIENAHNVLLSTLKEDAAAKEAYSSFHEALFRLPKMSKDHIQTCIDELRVLVDAVEAVSENESETLLVVWDALNVSSNEREKFWNEVEVETSKAKSKSDSSFDSVLSISSADLEDWIYMSVKEEIKANRLLNLKLLKLQKIHEEVEEKREKQDLKSKIITVDSEIRMISAKLAEFEEMAGNTQRLVTKKINSSNFLKEERFRKNVQSKFASKLEGLGKLLQEWQKKEGSTFDTNLLSEDVRALVVNLDGFDAWVEQRTAFMHLKTVKPKISARKGIATDTESALSEDGSTAPTDATLLSQPNSLTRSKLRNNFSHQDSWNRPQMSAASNSYSRGGSNISGATSSNTGKTESTTAASSSSRNAGLSPSSLQKATRNVRSERDLSKDTRGARTATHDTKRTTARQRVFSPGKFRSKSTPTKSAALNSASHKTNLENRSPKSFGLSSSSRSRSPASRATCTPKRIIIGSSNNPFGHVLTHEST